VQYHLEGLSRDELDAYLAHQLKAAGVTQPLFDDTARQALYQATKGILRKVTTGLTALRLAASRKESTVGNRFARCHHRGAAVSDTASKKSASPRCCRWLSCWSQQPSEARPACGAGTVAPSGHLFVGGEPKVGKSLLVANLALSLAAALTASASHPRAAPRPHLSVRAARRAVRQPSRLMRACWARRGSASSGDTRATGPSAQRRAGTEHFVSAARAAAAEIIVLDPLYSTHDQDENDTRAMAALCQSFCGCATLPAPLSSWCIMSAIHRPPRDWQRPSRLQRLHAVGDSYLLLTRPSPQLATIELRFQFRYAASQPHDCFSSTPHALVLFGR